MKRLSFGTRVKIRNIKDEDDQDLNGRWGRLTPKHRFHNQNRRLTFGDIGIVIENGDSRPIFANLLHGEYEKARL